MRADTLGGGGVGTAFAPPHRGSYSPHFGLEKVVAVGDFSLESLALMRNSEGLKRQATRLGSSLGSAGPSIDRRTVPPGQVAGLGANVELEMRRWWLSPASLPTAGRAHIHSALGALLRRVPLGLSLPPESCPSAGEISCTFRNVEETFAPWSAAVLELPPPPPLPPPGFVCFRRLRSAGSQVSVEDRGEELS